MRDDIETDLVGYGTQCHMGPSHPTIYLSNDDVYDLVNTKDNPNVPSREGSALKEWKKTIDRELAPVKLGDSKAQLLGSIRIVGDSCASCRYKRPRTLKELRPVRSSIITEYEAREGAQIGITIGFKRGSRILRADICPRRSALGSSTNPPWA